MGVQNKSKHAFLKKAINWSQVDLNVKTWDYLNIVSRQSLDYCLLINYYIAYSCPFSSHCYQQNIVGFKVIF